jgi:hypothetical protein
LSIFCFFFIFQKILKKKVFWSRLTFIWNLSVGGAGPDHGLARVRGRSEPVQRLGQGRVRGVNWITIRSDLKGEVNHEFDLDSSYGHGLVWAGLTPEFFKPLLPTDKSIKQYKSYKMWEVRWIKLKNFFWRDAF